MRVAALLLCTLALVLGAAGGSMAYENWSLRLSAYQNDPNLYSIFSGGIRTTPPATDGLDLGEEGIPPIFGVPIITSMDFGPPTFDCAYMRDFRSPNTANLTWHIRVYQSLYEVPAPITLSGYVIYRGPLPCRTATLDVINYIDDTTPVLMFRKHWDGTESGDQDNPDFTVVVDPRNCAQDWTFGPPGRYFDLELTLSPAVPEPGSCTALSCGLCGLLLGWRKRVRSRGNC